MSGGRARHRSKATHGVEAREWCTGKASVEGSGARARHRSKGAAYRQARYRGNGTRESEGMAYDRKRGNGAREIEGTEYRQTRQRGTVARGSEEAVHWVWCSLFASALQNCSIPRRVSSSLFRSLQRTRQSSGLWNRIPDSAV